MPRPEIWSGGRESKRVFVPHRKYGGMIAAFGGGEVVIGWSNLGSPARTTGGHPLTLSVSSGKKRTEEDERRNARTDKSTCTLPASQFLPSDLAARRFGGQAQEQGVESGTSFSENGRVHVLNCPKLAPAELQMNWGPVAWGGCGEVLGGTCPEHHQPEPIAGHQINVLQVPCTFSVTCPYLLPRSSR